MTMAARNNIKTRIKAVVAMFGLGLAVGVCIAAVFAAVPSLRRVVGEEIMPRGFWYFMMWWCIAMLLLAAAAVLQVLIHETGHLLGGLSSGYRFVSFRIGNRMVVKEQGRWSFKRFSIEGTAGQCLLEPPSTPDGKFPYRLYCMGGVAANLVVSVAAVAVAAHVAMPVFWAALLAMLFVSGTYIVITNGVPLKINGVPNDGYNLVTVGRDDFARRSLWLQLKVNALQSRGERLRDMPGEWFSLPEGTDMGNYMTVAVAGMAADRLIEMHCFEQARDLLERADAAGAGGVEIFRREVQAELLFVGIVTGGERWRLEQMYTPALRRHVERYGRYMLSCIRLQYAWARLVERDAAKAETLLARAGEVYAGSPVKGEADAEMELIRWVETIEP